MQMRNSEYIFLSNTGTHPNYSVFSHLTEMYFLNSPLVYVDMK
jgi:hypothetical protein